MKELFYYCQLQIEQEKKCNEQCNHCKLYYYHLEQDRKMEDIKNWIENK